MSVFVVVVVKNYCRLDLATSFIFYPQDEISHLVIVDNIFDHLGIIT